jgi:Bacterial protein of unknown function (DUF899)
VALRHPVTANVAGLAFCGPQRWPIGHASCPVFTLGPDGAPRHFYSAHPRMSDDIDQRGIDLLAPVWHVLDLTPPGRGNWYAQLDYTAKRQRPVSNPSGRVVRPGISGDSARCRR